MKSKELLNQIKILLKEGDIVCFKYFYGAYFLQFALFKKFKPYKIIKIEANGKNVTYYFEDENKNLILFKEKELKEMSLSLKDFI